MGPREKVFQERVMAPRLGLRVGGSGRGWHLVPALGKPAVRELKALESVAEPQVGVVLDGLGAQPGTSVEPSARARDKAAVLDCLSAKAAQPVDDRCAVAAPGGSQVAEWVVGQFALLVRSPQLFGCGEPSPVLPAEWRPARRAAGQSEPL